MFVFLYRRSCGYLAQERGSLTSREVLTCISSRSWWARASPALGWPWCGATPARDEELEDEDDVTTHEPVHLAGRPWRTRGLGGRKRRGEGAGPSGRMRTHAALLGTPGGGGAATTAS